MDTQTTSSQAQTHKQQNKGQKKFASFCVVALCLCAAFCLQPISRLVGKASGGHTSVGCGGMSLTDKGPDLPKSQATQDRAQKVLPLHELIKSLPKKEAFVSNVANDTPLQTIPTGTIVPPMPLEELEQELKSQQVTIPTLAHETQDGPLPLEQLEKQLNNRTLQK